MSSPMPLSAWKGGRSDAPNASIVGFRTGRSWSAQRHRKLPHHHLLPHLPRQQRKTGRQQLKQRKLRRPQLNRRRATQSLRSITGGQIRRTSQRKPPNNRRLQRLWPRKKSPPRHLDTMCRPRPNQGRCRHISAKMWKRARSLITSRPSVRGVTRSSCGRLRRPCSWLRHSARSRR